MTGMDMSQAHCSTSRRVLGFSYAIAAIAIMWLVWAAFVVFLCHPKALVPYFPFPTVDARDWVADPWVAAIIDTGLMAMFALQHSVMARPAFKRVWSGLLPAAFERSTYVHAANTALMLLIVLWQPIDTTVWAIEVVWLEQAVWGVFALGWLILLVSGRSFGMSELLGLRHVRCWAAGQTCPTLPLKTRGVYRWMRHPMYVGLLTGVWATPHMTVGHFLLAAGFSVYVLAASRFEERDLEVRYGVAYQHWRGERRRETVSG
jgi:methanethiol S-methyltransferase